MIVHSEVVGEHGTIQVVCNEDGEPHWTVDLGISPSITVLMDWWVGHLMEQHPKVYKRHHEAEEMTFDGDTFDPERDGVRLHDQWWDIWRFMLDGEWHTLHEISVKTHHPEASVSARLRDFRKRRFGGHDVEKEYLYEGQWVYRLTANPKVEISTEPEEDSDA